MKLKQIASVEVKKLGQFKAWGMADSAMNTVQLDSSLKGYRFLLYLIHEHLHIIHPDYSETKVRKLSSKYARFIWQQGFRRTEL
jgi:hypothetical protein